jgi:hypothetical protein
MKIAQSVRFGAWILISLNLLMALGSIWVFMRMAPAIEIIIDQNQVSLQACEEMLAALSMKGGYEPDSSPRIESFRHALRRAANNITERKEPVALDAISHNYQKAFEGDDAALAQTVKAILQLGEINRAAMTTADRNARQLGYAGAWGVVFMATALFLIGMIFLRSLNENLSNPLMEIDSVVKAFHNGDTMRRCTSMNPSKSLKQLFVNVNELLDRANMQQFHGHNKSQE